MKQISRAVWILSLVSLFTDMASEMLYPIMPLYLKQIGFSIFLIGILEGFAEATAGLSKGYFGQRSDISGKRTPFVQMGYALSAISKPMLALFVFPVWIFFSRTIDRLGKGILTGARDAILSAEATPANKARIFGFHRSMDTLGAVFGPALALVYLYYFPNDYFHLFIIAFLPGMIAVGATFLLKKDKNTPPKQVDKKGFFSFLNYWKTSDSHYRKLLVGLLAFALVNSSDVFLLLQLKQSGMTDTAVIGIYIFYNFIYALCAYPLGILADRMGLKNTFVFGLCLFAIVYFGFALNDHFVVYIVLFVLYGIYGAATEGISKAWITNICKSNETATAVGTYTALQSISAMVASSLTGFIWFQYGSTAAFLFSAIATSIVIAYFISIPPSQKVLNVSPAETLNPQLS
ncbi:MFS transporter [Cryomorpha ignava]|uniref:MFS transporter n=1 Tax=Cryomorpha ignava TaxID=101383 RepID=A0A7K3WN35_9FLAO|nr:MFS transporter [Cryomorpha ignava]NEN22282.1 MFS transporter [Cryomorpha ignava]